tara:strand:- start:1577 stop:1750 length:174 start_codon:yes stop_codon:yes gene_type:complete
MSVITWEEAEFYATELLKITPSNSNGMILTWQQEVFNRRATYNMLLKLKTLYDENNT